MSREQEDFLNWHQQAARKRPLSACPTTAGRIFLAPSTLSNRAPSPLNNAHWTLEV